MIDQSPPAHRAPRVVQRAARLFMALGVLAAATYIILRAAGATRMNVDRTVFTIVNTITLTGFQQPVNVADLNGFAQLAIFLLLCGSVLTWLIVGGWALVRVLRMPIGDDEVALGAIITFSLGIVIGATILIEPTRTTSAAIFEAASAFGNFGLSLQRVPGPLDWKLHAVLLPLALLGGLGIPVLLDLASSLSHFRRPHRHTAAAVTGFAIFYLLGVGLLLITEGQSPATFRDRAIIASAESLDARTLGMTSGNINSLTRASQGVLLLLMAVGASAAGTGGGIKTTTIYLLCRDAVQALRSGAARPAFAIAWLWLACWTALAFVATVVLLAWEPQLAFERIVLVAVSAASNVGLCHEPVSVGTGSLLVLSLVMLLGRLCPLGLLVWASRRGIETDIAVG